MLGFWSHLYPRRGLGDTQAEQFTQNLSNYCLEHQWLMKGAPLRSFVQAQDRDMGYDDLIDFVAWLTQEGTVVRVELSDLCTYSRSSRSETSAYCINLVMTDPVFQAANTLYQLHRVNGYLAFELLRSDLSLERSAL
jgi:hypothetical protein